MKLQATVYILILFVLSSCRYFGGERIYGNGTQSSQQRSVDGITGVRVKGSLDVYLSQGPATAVRLEGDQNLLEYIEVVKEGNIVEVYTRRGYNLKPTKDLKVYVTAPALNQFYIDGSGDIKTQTKITDQNAIKSEIRGSGDVVMDVDAPNVDASISGSGSIVIKGNTKNFTGSIAGSGDIKCFDLLSETADVDIKGAGTAEVFASRQLNVDIKGSGDVQYKGNANVSQSIHGAGSVTKAQ
jgi:hypothetical protein